MYLTLFFLAILLVCVAMLYQQGLWSCALTLVNVLIAGLLSMHWFEPLARVYEGWDSTLTFFWDFLALWSVFVLSMIVLRILTDTLSKYKVRFRRPVELGGAIFLSLWVGWIMICFTATTLHTAPLAQQSFGGSFYPTPEARIFFGLAPDRRWLAFTHMVSNGGSLSRGEPVAFDPAGEFILKYGARRADLETRQTLRQAK